MTETPWTTAFADVGWQLPDVLTEKSRPEAVKRLAAYLAHDHAQGPDFTGSFFHRLGGPGDSPETKDTITAADILAVCTLSMRVQAQEVIGLLTDTTAWPRQPHSEEGLHIAYVHPLDPDEVSRILRNIPTDIRLEELSDDDLARYDSLWDELYYALRRKNTGHVWIHKIAARKRPHLIPIYDSKVRAELGINHSRGFLKNLHRVLRAENGALARHLEGIRSEVPAAADLSIIRVFDIVLWMGHQEQTSR